MFIEQLLTHQTISYDIAKSREGNSSMFLQTPIEAGGPMASNNVLYNPAYTRFRSRSVHKLFLTAMAFDQVTITKITDGSSLTITGSLDR